MDATLESLLIEGLVKCPDGEDLEAVMAAIADRLMEVSSADRMEFVRRMGNWLHDYEFLRKKLQIGQLVASVEREACALICDRIQEQVGSTLTYVAQSDDGVRRAAEAIRARSNVHKMY